jgi:DNA-binding Lrp family transcriptional regulator
MILQDRDNKIIDFLQLCPADSVTIQKLYFTGKRTCNERLKKLADYGYIKRWRSNVNSNYIYYVKRKPMQLEHCNYIAKSFLWIQNQGYQIEKFKREVNIEDVRADALAKINNKGKDGYLILEVELSNNNAGKKIMKYEDLYLSRKYKKYFDVMPKLLYVTDQNIKSDILNVINVKLKELP